MPRKKRAEVSIRRRDFHGILCFAVVLFVS